MVEIPAIIGGKPVRNKVLPYGLHWIEKQEIEAVKAVLTSDWITQGAKIAEFENTVAQYCGAKYSVALSNGTAALHAACYAAGIKTGDEVITSPMTFVASANCILYMNGKPRFVDVEEDTGNIDVLKIERAITNKTKAIIPIHLSGHPCNMDKIFKIAKKYKLIVIEDACHALGAEYSGKRIGSLSDMTVFSFHPVKHITTGEGGMVLTNDNNLYARLRLFRTHGITRDETLLTENDGAWYYEMQELGFNYRITDFQCALGIEQFKKLDRFINIRRAYARMYDNRFKRLPAINIPKERKYAKSAYHLYVIQLKLEKLKVSRKEIFNALKAENIGVNVHYIPVHLHPYYRKIFGYRKGDYPIAEAMYERVITLPLFPKMTSRDVEDVVRAVRKVVDYYRK